METIYNKIEKAINDANIEGIKYVRSYPADCVRFNKSDDEILDDEDFDTVTPLANALEVIAKTINENATIDDSIEIRFGHLPGDEIWRISIGDGR